MVFLKEFFQKFNFEKNQQTTKKHEKLPSRQCVNMSSYAITFIWFSSEAGDDINILTACMLKVKSAI